MWLCVCVCVCVERERENGYHIVSGALLLAEYNNNNMLNRSLFLLSYVAWETPYIEAVVAVEDL